MAFGIISKESKMISNVEVMTAQDQSKYLLSISDLLRDWGYFPEAHEVEAVVNNFDELVERLRAQTSNQP